MAATAARKRTAKMVAPEATRATGRMQVLPAGSPEVVSVSVDEHVAVAAMVDKKTSGSTPTKGKTTSGSPSPKQDPKKGASVTLNDTGMTNTSKAKVDGYAGQSPAGMGGSASGSTGRDGDPDVAYAFEVKIGSISYGMFSEISGLSWKAEPVAIRSGGNNEHGLNMRGPGKFEPLVMKRGWFASSGEFFDMLLESLSGSDPRGSTQTGRVNITISVLNRKYSEIGSYQLKNAFIIEYTGPTLNSMSGQVGFEQIRMAYDNFIYQPK
ncbi:MAG: phage tail protein [Myxococcota bacterium]